MVQLAVLAFLLLAPILGVSVGRWLLRRYPQKRWPWVAVAVLALTAVAVCVRASFAYPGPQDYPAWSVPWAVRATGLFVITLPVWVSLAALLVLPRIWDRRNPFIAAIAGYLSFAAVLILGIIVGCNQAGACL